IYLLLFGISRFALEFVRERSEIHFGLSVAQWVSLEITIAMLIALAWIYFRNNNATKEMLD
ncbi:MAG: prolipoprotein diacylglyceryl transferase, partial [Candidatus Obscuribacterales bacterium]|nr:prolipoprotein diacylglyceryl transferase [Candidatus Obscuribacterales bacterium]